MKTVFEFDDYRVFLKEFYSAAKKRDEKFSFRYFSRVTGSKSPSFFKQVIEGQRNLTARHIENLIHVLKFSEEEGFFFRNLVHLNQAKSVEEKQPFIKKILQSQAYRKMHPLTTAQYDFFAKWFCVPIRELVALQGFKEDYKWIARQLKFAVSESQVKTAIGEMLELGLLQRDSQGRLIQSQAHIVTDDQIISSVLAKSHQDLIAKGAESIDSIPREQREIMGITFAISQSSLEKVKQKVLNFRREMVELLSEEKNPDSVYQFHLLFFPLAQIEKERK